MHYSLTTLLGAIGVCIATPSMAAATQVNIADPTTPSHIAKVEIGNRLAVQEVPPANFFHAGIGVDPASGCNHVASAPTGRALIVRQVRVTVTSSGGSGTF